MVVDAAIIHASSSATNRDGKREFEMHLTKKRNPYYFSMKAHIGFDTDSELSVFSTDVATSDNEELKCEWVIQTVPDEVDGESCPKTLLRRSAISITLRFLGQISKTHR